MITSNERCEIAAKLREKYNERFGMFVPQDIEIQVSSTLEDIIDCLPPIKRSIFLTLADLIESESINGKTSDGYHTFDELYHHRAILFSVIVRNYPELCWKSKKHHTGDMYDGMFIVGINTPDGQASYHYDIEPYWDMFECEELEFAPEWDGHTPAQAIERIGKLTRREPERMCELIKVHDWNDEWEPFGYECKSCGKALPRCYGSDKFGTVITPNYCPNCGAKIVKTSENTNI